MQFHFHSLSEHFLFGEQFELELHLVHRSADRGLLVIGRFIIPGDRLEELDEVIAAIEAGGGFGWRISTSTFSFVEADLLSLSGLDHHSALHRGRSMDPADRAAGAIGGSDRAESAGASRHQRRLRQRPPAAVAQRTSNPDRREARCRMMTTTAMTAPDGRTATHSCMIRRSTGFERSL